MLVRRTLPWLLAAVSLVQATPTRTLPIPGPSETDPSPDDNTCSDYKTCSRKGHGYWIGLQAVLSQAQPADKTDGKAIFGTDYGCEFITIDQDTTPGLSAIRGDLENHGYEWKWVEAFGAFSKDPVTGHDTEQTAYSNMFYTSKGLIVAVENYRDLDEQETLPWSEIIYQAWQYARKYDDESKAADTPRGHPGSGSISTLQTVVQVDVQNQETRLVTKTIWDAAGKEYNTGDKIWYKFTEADTPNWFYALLGTVNVKGTLFLLKDHAAEIGKKTITAIWVRWPGPDPDIWIDIGPQGQHIDQQ